MKILSIGNSFSQDAQRYLHRIAKAEGVELKTVNLYIGGCSLKTHYNNILENNCNYLLEFNGDSTGVFVTIKQALMSEDWDFVTLQQQSARSADFDTYTPYIQELADYVKKYSPKSKILLHQTWSYLNGSHTLLSLGKFNTTEEMQISVNEAYDKAFDLIKPDGLIPCGKAMIMAQKLGLENVYRDNLHVSLGAGRYLLGLCWYKKLTGKDITNNTFNDFDVEVSDAERELVIKAVNSVF